MRASSIQTEPLHALRLPQPYFVAAHHSPTDRVHQNQCAVHAPRGPPAIQPGASRVLASYLLYVASIILESAPREKSVYTHVATSPASLTSLAQPSERDRASKIHSVRPRASYVSCNPRSPLSRCCVVERCVARAETSKKRRKARRFEILLNRAASESGAKSANKGGSSSSVLLASSSSSSLSDSVVVVVVVDIAAGGGAWLAKKSRSASSSVLQNATHASPEPVL